MSKSWPTVFRTVLTLAQTYFVSEHRLTPDITGNRVYTLPNTFGTRVRPLGIHLPLCQQSRGICPPTLTGEPCKLCTLRRRTSIQRDAASGAHA